MWALMDADAYRQEDEGGYWPTRMHELLLKAALLQGDVALDAWNGWMAGVDLDRLDQGSYRLLPLLYRNLVACGVDDPLLRNLKGIYRMAWYRNQMLFRTAASLLQALHDAGIRTMLLKGLALSLLYYRDYGLRPMYDWDVVVPIGQAQEAIRLMIELGWRPKARSPRVLLRDGFFSVSHSCEFRDDDDHACDLHWHVLDECRYENADDDFWGRAAPVEFFGVRTLALDPTDQLLHVCVHGARWSRVPPVRWVADAAMILNSQSMLDWERLVAHVRKRRLVLQMVDTLGYLRDLLDAPVPPLVLQRLCAMPVSTVERMEHWVKTRPLGRLTGHLLQDWFRNLRTWRSADDAPLRPGFFGLLRYFQLLWGVDHLWQVPFHVVLKGARRLRTRLC